MNYEQRTMNYELYTMNNELLKFNPLTPCPLTTCNNQHYPPTSVGAPFSRRRHGDVVWSMNNEQPTMNKNMQNKPNLPDAQVNVTSFITKDYENICLRRCGKNKAKQTQFTPLDGGFRLSNGANPIQTQFQSFCCGMSTCLPGPRFRQKRCKNHKKSLHFFQNQPIFAPVAEPFLSSLFDVF